jgi:hypothetical protein
MPAMTTVHLTVLRPRVKSTARGRFYYCPTAILRSQQTTSSACPIFNARSAANRTLYAEANVAVARKRHVRAAVCYTQRYVPES